MITLQDALKLSGGGIVSLVGAGGKTSLMLALAAELSVSGESVLVTTTTKIEHPPAQQSGDVIIENDPAKLAVKCKSALEKQRIVTAAAARAEPRGKLVGFPAEVISDLGRGGIFRWIVVEADGAARKPIKAPARHEPVISADSRWVIGVVGLSAIGKPFTDRWVFRTSHFGLLSGLSPGEPVSAAAAARVLLHSNGVMKGAPRKAVRMCFLNQADTPERLEQGRRIAALLSATPGGFERAVIGQLKPAPRVIDCIDLLRQGKR